MLIIHFFLKDQKKNKISVNFNQEKVNKILKEKGIMNFKTTIPILTYRHFK
jgi:hypothetical protein